jgi:hypothetical protein
MAASRQRYGYSGVAAQVKMLAAGFADGAGPTVRE